MTDSLWSPRKIFSKEMFSFCKQCQFDMPFCEFSTSKWRISFFTKKMDAKSFLVIKECSPESIKFVVKWGVQLFSSCVK